MTPTDILTAIGLTLLLACVVGVASSITLKPKCKFCGERPKRLFRYRGRLCCWLCVAELAREIAREELNSELKGGAE